MPESTIILAIIGMIGLFATATVFQRANKLSQRYYNNDKCIPRVSTKPQTESAKSVGGANP